MSLRLLSVLLAATAASAQSGPQSPCACGVGEICLDRRTPVTPLPRTLLPDESVTIRVIHKSPFETIVFKAEFAEVERVDAAVFEKLFRLVAKIALALPPLLFPPPPDPGLLPKRPRLQDQELDELVSLIEAGQAQLQAVISGIKTSFEAEDKLLKAFRAKPYQRDCNAATFETDLKERITAVAIPAETVLPSASGTRLLTDRLAHLVKTTTRSLPLPDVHRINSVLQAQGNLEAALDALRDAQEAFADAGRVLEIVKNSSATWFAASRTYSAPAERKATVQVSAKPLGGGDSEKLATVTLSWLSPPRFSLSLGVALSSVAKQEFYTETVRDPGLLLTDPKVFSHRINQRVTRPVIFPASLVHVRLTGWNKGKAGVSAALGAGVNPAGDSPTGELLFGASFRFGNIFLTPGLHLGRQQQLADGFKLLEASPKPADFTPSTLTRWKPGFAVVVTYRLPL